MHCLSENHDWGHSLCCDESQKEIGRGGMKLKRDIGEKQQIHTRKFSWANNMEITCFN